MGLNIKNERVCDLAREAAQVIGSSQTGAIEEALVMLLRSHGRHPEQVAQARSRASVAAILARVDQQLAEATPAHPMTSDDLYDEVGIDVMGEAAAHLRG